MKKLILGLLLVAGCSRAPSGPATPTPTPAPVNKVSVEKIPGFKWELGGFQQTDSRPFLRGKTVVVDLTALDVSPAQEKLSAALRATSLQDLDSVVCVVVVTSRPQNDPPKRPAAEPLPGRYPPRGFPGSRPNNPGLNHNRPPQPPPPPPTPPLIWEAAVVDLPARKLSRWHKSVAPSNLFVDQVAVHVNGLDFNPDPKFVRKERKFTAAEAKAAIAERYKGYSQAWIKRNPDSMYDLYSRNFSDKGKPAYTKRIEEIKEEFRDIGKLENEVGILDLDQSTRLTEVTMKGAHRAKVQYRSIQTLTQRDGGRELRLEDEAVGVDYWAFEDDTWRIVAEPEGKVIRSQKILNGKVVENLPID